MEINKKSINIWDMVASNFGKIEPKYCNDFGSRLVELSSISKGARVLDIGMGRGASLFPALDKVGKDGYVKPFDKVLKSLKIVFPETKGNYRNILYIFWN